MKKITLVIFIWVLFCVQLFAVEHKVRISGYVDFLKDGDTVTVTVSPYTGKLSEIKTTFKGIARGNEFSVEITGSESPRFIEARFSKVPGIALASKLLFPGDDLAFRLDRGKTVFYGPSAGRFEVQQGIQELSKAFRLRYSAVYAPEALPAAFSLIDSCTTICLDNLQNRKQDIGNFAFLLLRNNLISGGMISKLAYLTDRFYKPLKEQEGVISVYRNRSKEMKSFPQFVPANNRGVPASSFSCELIYQQYLVDSCIMKGKKFSLHDCYQFESLHFNGEIREQLLTELFMRKRNNPELKVSDIDDALVYISNPGFRSELEKIKSLNMAGTIAPEFVLTDINNNPVKLSDFRGKLMVLDFWFTGCGACKGLAPTLFKLEKKYEHSPVVFISVSIDKSREQWLATLKTNDYASPLAVRLYTEGKGEEHEVIKKFSVHGYPTVLLIDKEGRFCPKAALNEQGLSDMIDRFLK
ncbi:TlpA family protein disulfide reductase [Mucilaginibacter celer]|uniref:TlpA family protein disulfide reductase n=1 Tax=Mucilaginibacter celer TaxID=2305508 RepID=A0A494VSZ7_9SPHI|nr:TlpA disulfide reductase family protein [Mucilaginibacter celer]AYL96540.1 TlpA family protein disulfide reductase [Mucilaginibacter celer]